MEPALSIGNILLGYFIHGDAQYGSKYKYRYKYKEAKGEW